MSLFILMEFEGLLLRISSKNNFAIYPITEPFIPYFMPNILFYFHSMNTITFANNLFLIYKSNDIPQKVT